MISTFERNLEEEKFPFSKSGHFSTNWCQMPRERKLFGCGKISILKCNSKLRQKKKKRQNFKKVQNIYCYIRSTYFQIGEKRNFGQREFNFRIQFNFNQAICAKKVCWMVVHY